MALSHEVHEGIMAEVSPSVHTALLLSMLLTELRRSMVGKDAKREPADMPSVVALANLAVRLHQAPPSPYVPLRRKSPHDAAMAIAGQIATTMVDVGLGAPGFASATFRVADLGGAADTIEGLLYAALTCLHVCLLGEAHARNKNIYMLLLALVVYPGLEPLHPSSLGALGDKSKHVAPLVLSCVTRCLSLMLSRKGERRELESCLAACVDCRGAVAAQLRSGWQSDGKTTPEALASLNTAIAATLDMLHHFAEL